MSEYPFEDGIDHLLFDDPTPDQYGLDPDTVDDEDWENALAVARVVAHNVAEGLMEIEEDDQGEVRCYPVT